MMYHISKKLFAILQKYDFSSKSQLTLPLWVTEMRCLRYCKSTIFQANHNKAHCHLSSAMVVCDTAKVRFFKQITTNIQRLSPKKPLFAILQKYDFSSKSQLSVKPSSVNDSCLRYCKSTIFQANHNQPCIRQQADVLFAILQKYDFSSKSQHGGSEQNKTTGCLRYCKSTIFQANHNCSGISRP